MKDKRPRLKFDAEKLRGRLLLWGLAVPFFLLAVLVTATLIDGRTRFLWERTVTIWDDPLHFTASATVGGLIWIVTAIFYLAAIGWDKQHWLPPQLRDKPLVPITCLIVLTAAAVVGGIELASGETTVRRLGHISADGTPVRYALFVLVYMAFCAVLAFGWYLAFSEWRYPESRRWKPEFDDPGKRGRM